MESKHEYGSTLPREEIFEVENTENYKKAKSILRLFDGTQKDFNRVLYKIGETRGYFVKNSAPDEGFELNILVKLLKKSPKWVKKLFGDVGLLRFMAEQALSLGDYLKENEALVGEPCRILAPQRNTTVKLSKKLVHSINCCMFFCMLPCIDCDPKYSFPLPSMVQLLINQHHQNAVVAKLECLFTYFQEMRHRIETKDPSLNYFVIFERRVGEKETLEKVQNSNDPLLNISLDEHKAIEETDGNVYVDFANSLVGGGVLSYGCAQEEILFAKYPEMIAAMALCPEMWYNECVMMCGVEPFSETEGYAGSLEFKGEAPRCTKAVETTTGGIPVVFLPIFFVAIDAYFFGGKPGTQYDPENQWKPDYIHREMYKCASAFKVDGTDITNLSKHAEYYATGNWGCGAFGGDPELKLLIQWMASSLYGRELRYCTFGDTRLEYAEAFIALIHHATNMTVGGLYNLLMENVEEIKRVESKLQYLHDKVLEQLERESRVESDDQAM